MVHLWMSWCRLCAREDPGNSHENVLLKNEEGLPLTDTIAQCFSIDMNNFNNLPVMICTDCYNLIKSLISFNQRLTKANAMFAELQEVTSENEFNVHSIKVRHNLDDCDSSINPENTNDFATRGKLSVIDEQMVDMELMPCDKTDDSNPINIKVEEDEIDSASQSGESSNDSTEKTNQKDIQKTRKKYKSKKERWAENMTKPHYCPDCHKGYTLLYNYRRHMQSTHNITIEYSPPRFICETCGNEYKTKSALAEHERSHTEVRTLKCQYCEKTFKGNPTLKKHEETHSESVSCICFVCGLQLNTKQTLRMHMVVHSDQKKYKCDYCGNEFKRAKALKNHLILHTGLKPYSCDFCDRTFASGANCRSHKKKNHPVELAALEAAGKKNISKARIPKLKELKAITASKAEVGKPNDHANDSIEDASSEPMTRHYASFMLKSEPEVVPSNDMQYEKPSSKEQSDFFQRIFGTKTMSAEG